MADAAETRAGVEVGFEYRSHRVAEAEVGEADDPGGDPSRILGALQTRRATVHEFGLADWPQLYRTVCPVLLVALDIDGAGYPVAAARVGKKVLGEIAVRREFPEVVVRVADLEVGLDRVLDRAREPLLPFRHGASAPT